MKLESQTMDAQPGRTTGPFLIGLIVLTLFAGAMRCYRLGEPSFWIDELFTVKWAAATTDLAIPATRWLSFGPQALGMSLAGIEVSELPNSADPNDNTDMSQWMAAGVREHPVRVPTAVTGIVSIFLLGWASLRFMGTRAAIILTLLLAVSTWHLWMSQVARFYAQQFLLYNLCLIFYYDATRRRAAMSWVWCCLFLVLAFATQITSLMILGVFAIDWLAGLVWKDQRRWSGVGWAALIVGFVLCVLVYIPELIYKGGDPVGGFEGSRQSVANLVAGLPFLVGAPLFVFALCSAWWVYRADPRLSILLLAAGLVPLAAIAIFGLAHVDIHIRYVFPALYAWLALAALGLGHLYQCLESRAGRLAAAAPVIVLVVASLFTCYAYYTGGFGYRARWREAFAYVKDHREPDSVVVGDYIPSIVGAYYLEEPQIGNLGSAFGRRPDLQSDDELRAAAAANTRPVWVVVRGVSATQGQRETWMDRVLDLRAYYSSRVLQPYNAVHVYHHPGGAGAADGGGSTQ